MDNASEIISKPEPLLLRPNTPRSEMVVNLSIKHDELRVWSVYDGDVVQLCKRLHFRWSRPFWVRKISLYYGGKIEDRLIETAYELLTENFIVEISAEIENLQTRIESGDYADEQTRWIFKRTDGLYEGWFAISWKRYKENFYTEARRLTSARWSNPAVVVKPEFFEEVLDFAEINGFELTKAAKELVEKAQTAREQAIRVELKPRVSKKIAKTEEVIGEIADDLRDDD